MMMRGSARWAGAAFVLTGAAILAQPAAAQDYERVLAGIRLNSKSTAVLARYGNPNEVVIGDVGVRGTGPNTPGGGGAGVPGAPTDGGMGTPGMPGMGGMSAPGMPGGMGGSGMPGMPGRMGGMGAPGMGGMGAPGGFSPGGPEGDGSMSGGGPPAGYPGGFPGAGGSGFPGSGGTAGGGVGPFGQTVSTLARQQEVTWIYNRKVNNNLVSYEFLIGPNGNVSQIRVSGYSGGNSRTKRGASLGTTYKDVVRMYGYPEEHVVVGRVLVASYRKTAHVQFQFMNERGQANPMSAGNKVVAVTIATVE